MRFTVIIAEAGVNHNGDINMAKKLIEAASNAGATYVKFQTFKTENLVSKTAEKASYQSENMGEGGTQFDMLKKLELSKSDHLVLIDHCKKHAIKFLSTAFDLDSIDLLDELGVDVFKIPSGEITNYPYLKKIASKGKPVVLSTGMATMDEIRDAFHVLTENGMDKKWITILHCTTQYPTPLEFVHLRAMQTIAKEFDVAVGYSDHTMGIEVAVAAVAMGATVIEKHITLDRTLPGPDHKASIEPKEFHTLVKYIRQIEKAFGSPQKMVTSAEEMNKIPARKSIHLANDLKKGETLKEEDLIAQRPGNGISPMKWNEVIGKKIKTDKKKGDILHWQDVE